MKKKITKKVTSAVVECGNNGCSNNTCYKTTSTAGTCKLDKIVLTKHWVGNEKYYNLTCQNASDIAK